jgi:hypothetical protein
MKSTYFHDASTQQKKSTKFVRDNDFTMTKIMA